MPEAKSVKPCVSELLVKAWAEAKNPKFDSVNPHFKNRYTSLAEVEKIVREICIKHKIAIFIRTCIKDEMTVFSSVAVGGDGEEAKLSEIAVTLPQDPQKAGSAITYYRRYLLLLSLGLVGEEDDDANEAVEARATESENKNKEELLKKLRGLKISANISDETYFEQIQKVSDSKASTDLDLTEQMLSLLVAAYEKQLGIV